MSSCKGRLAMGLLSLGYVFISILFILIALGWFVPLDSFSFFLMDFNNRWILGLTSFLVFVLTFTLFFNSFKIKPIKLTTIHNTALGQIDITLSALEQLVLKAVKKIPVIQEVKPVLKLTEKNISVLLKIKVNADVNIPQITAELQHVIKEYLLETSGTSLQEIKIQVTEINIDPKTNRVE
ncbi:MAG: alkaline shock response membrane anchor protein AmaP [Clostridia bacterium]|nr:alkaline shock response membrane anchor protein AmaP [Clostridia bacterium]MDD4146658.1 alkaline shock response membrane anchor protein AmaP [Clostridia bacterium]MDD4664949.1 alkaline shock response membrane anchor protein AmaP [Clostridia bacterium]